MQALQLLRKFKVEEAMRDRHPLFGKVIFNFVSSFKQFIFSIRNSCVSLRRRAEA